VLPTIGEHNRVGRRTNTQLLRMLAAQILLIVISTLPYSIYRLYASFTANVVKDPFRIAQENFTSQSANVISYFAHTSSFYLYTLTGTTSRKELFKIIARCFPHNHNIVRIDDGRMNQVPVIQSNRRIIAIFNTSTQ
jgi:hypothetical protein